MIATNLLQSLLGRGVQQPVNGIGDPYGAAPRRLPPVAAAAPPPEINPAAMRGIFDAVNQGQNSASSLASVPQVDTTIPAAAPPQQHHGIFGRIGDFIKSDEGKAILLRSGAKTITDGLGAGIAEGANYAADQKDKALKQNNWLAELGVKQQQANSEADYRRGELHNATNKNAIEAQKASDENIYQLGLLGFKGKELEDRHAQWVAANQTTQHGQDLSYDSSMYGHRVSRANAIGDNETSRANTTDMVNAAQGKTAAGIASSFSPLITTKSADPATGQTTTTAQRYPAPTPQDIAAFRMHPDPATFDGIFGPGASKRYVGGR